MAVQGTFYRTETQRLGVTPVSPPNAVDDPVTPLNPPGSNPVHDPVTIGSPANGLSLVGQQLSIGLASSGVTGVLSGTDWNKFDGKLDLTSPITGYTLGSNTALTATDTILQAFGKVQGQINAKIGGSGVINRIPKFTNSTTIGDSDIFTSGTLVGFNVSPSAPLHIRFNGENTIRFDFSAGLRALIGVAFSNGQISTTSVADDLVIRSQVGNILFSFSGTEKVRMTSSGQMWINTTSGTNTLDVNGTARIRTINNLGTAATVLLTKSATGVISERTLAELASDGLGSKWTDVGSDIYRNSAVAIGKISITSGSKLDVDGSIFVRGGSATYPTGTYMIRTASPAGTIPWGLRQDAGESLTPSLARFETSSGLLGFINTLYANSIGTLTLLGGSGKQVALSANQSLTPDLLIDTSGNTNIRDGKNLIFSGTTGTKIGTATTQKLAFWNATPIVQPSGDILTALSNLGLIASPTITQVDQFAVKTTASADQTLPSGTLTILDYDSTLLNNSTATYTVGTDGRITINTTGVYTITAGVVIEAGAVTALESAFLGIFRNGDLVAISSINTTIAAGTQSGLSTSTILSLTATDIIDCRALVNSVGGVANGLARRLGTLLGASATQVNSLSITKNSM